MKFIIYLHRNGGGYAIIELANIVKFIYENRYNKKIDIIKNSNDKAIYGDISVKNDKIKKVINFQTNDRINETINKIFDLLEI